MFRLKLSSDDIQFGILSLMILTAVGSACLWIDAHYAHASDVQSLKTEVDALYLKLIPENERLQTK